MLAPVASSSCKYRMLLTGTCMACAICVADCLSMRAPGRGGVAGSAYRLMPMISAWRFTRGLMPRTPRVRAVLLPDSRPLCRVDAADGPACQFTALARTQPDGFAPFVPFAGLVVADTASTSAQPPSTLTRRNVAPAATVCSTGAEPSLSLRSSVARKVVRVWPGTVAPGVCAQAPACRPVCRATAASAASQLGQSLKFIVHLSCTLPLLPVMAQSRPRL